MTVQEAIARRRSIRSFTGAPLTQAQLNTLLDAARLAPSSLNSQPWRFKVLTGAEDKAWLAGSVSRQQGLFTSAGAVLLCCADISGYLKESAASVQAYVDSGFTGPVMEGIKDYLTVEQASARERLRAAGAMNVALAVSQMMLQAVELGLGTCWVGMFGEDAIKARFGLGEELAVIALLAVGVPAGEHPGPATRKPLDAILLP
ncbi:nitroreductase family protein [Megalodesulfovibrio gigas]|nr:nitroreductase family protein [Megalodesulfovibrio gigas]